MAIFDSSASVVSSLLAFANTILAVSLTIGYLGEERFGIWMTVASIASMLSFMDFGVGNGMVSQIARSNVANEKRALALTATRGLLTLSLIGAVVGLGLFLANSIFPLFKILNIKSEDAIADAQVLISVFIILFAINIPVSGFFKILQGLQRGWMVHTTRSCASILSLLLIYVLSRNEAAPVFLLLATYGVTVITPMALLPWCIKSGLLTRKANSDWQAAKSEYRSLINFGGLFLVLQLGIMVGWGSDAFIISALTTVSAVTQFAIVQRLYQVVSIPMNILNNPLWGAYADAHAHGDTEFIRRTLKVSLAGTLLMSTGLSLTLFFLSDHIITIWIDDHVDISRNLILAFTVWKVLQSLGHAFSMALNGLHIVKIQVYSVLLLCFFAIPLKVIYTPQFGAAGAVWSTVIAYTLSTVLFYIFSFRHHIIANFRQHNQADN